MYQLEGSPNEAEAAAIAAVMTILGVEAAQGEVASPTPERWRDAARMTTQGLIPTRTAVAPRWGRIERLRRAGRGSTGITGQ
ncbi:MAG: hypothetical protein AB4911_03250 [Oscillochloridaceae bacterium umkhey_bin13]